MSIAHISPFPYILLFMVILSVAALCYYKFPSLRTYRKKKNLLVLPILIILLGLVAYQAYDASLGPAVVSYKVNVDNNQLLAGQINQLEISCENLGLRELTFYMTLKGVNASLMIGNQHDYLQVNNSTIQIPFHFNAFSIHAKETKPALFAIDERSTGFIVDFNCPITATGSTNNLDGVWNDTTNSYMLRIIPGPSI